MQHIGIVGAGQLAAYLCRAARKLGDETTVLAHKADDVAIAFADHAIVGDPGDQDVMASLASATDVITFDYEDIPPASLQQLAEQTHCRILPDPRTLMMLQNKALQKTWLSEQGYPTSPFQVFDQGINPEDALAEFGQKFVIKTQTGGYDGLGVYIVREGQIPSDYETVPVIAEQFVPKATELAVLVARDQEGTCAPYPVFESTFDKVGNVLRQVTCPAPQSEAVASRAIELGVDVVNRLNGVGVFAVEMFATENDLQINEISPRVHNVGHLTIEAANISQFEQHIRAITGRPVVPVTEARPAVMTNLLWEQELDAAWRQEAETAPTDGTFVHWYGKRAARPLRKVGHVTTVADTNDEAFAAAKVAFDELKAIA